MVKAEYAVPSYPSTQDTIVGVDPPTTNPEFCVPRFCLKFTLAVIKFPVLAQDEPLYSSPQVTTVGVAPPAA